MKPPARILLLAALAGVLVAVVTAGIVLAGREDSETAAGQKASRGGPAPARADGAKAPELEGRDPVSGKNVSLADFRGKPVVVNVWASWCPGCNEEATDLREFAAAHPEAVVLGLDYQDSIAGAKGFYRKWDWAHPSIYDASGAKAAQLGLVGLPMTFFLDSDHRVVARISGATDRAGFERGLDLATS